MEVLVVLIVFGSIAAMIVLPMWFREKTKQSAHRLLAEAIARGEKVDPDLIARLSDPPAKQHDRPRRTLGSAVILLALAGAMTGSAYFSGDFDPSGHAFGGQMTAAAILGALGLAFLILAIVDYNSKRNEPPRSE
ncbi:MAG: hypothetical protein HXY28_09325 [Hydrogenophilaceae bacterium]|jgi:hypothetical protein|nr:hypothetical protein [Hydrogenophilaceae bacterium]